MTSLEMLWAIRDLRDPRLTATSRHVMTTLVLFRDRAGRIAPSIRQLVDATGHSRSTIMRSVRDLRRLGYVEAVDGRGRYATTSYVVRLESTGVDIDGCHGETSHTETSQCGTTRGVMVGLRGVTVGLRGVTVGPSEDLSEDQREDLSEDLYVRDPNARTRTTSPESPRAADDDDTPPGWFVSTVGTVGMATGIDLPVAEAWLMYRGHRASKGKTMSHADAQCWLTSVMVRGGHHDRERSGGTSAPAPEAGTPPRRAPRPKPPEPEGTPATPEQHAALMAQLDAFVEMQTPRSLPLADESAFSRHANGPPSSFRAGDGREAVRRPKATSGADSADVGLDPRVMAIWTRYVAARTRRRPAMRKSRPSPAEVAKALDALERFDVDALSLAAEGLFLDPWHLENELLDFGRVFDDRQIERFILLAEDAKPKPPKPRPQVPDGERIVPPEEAEKILQDGLAMLAGKRLANTLFEDGSAGMVELVATYESAVASATGRPFALPGESGVRRALATAANTHCRGDGTIRGSLAAVREAVTEWVTTHGEVAQFQAGWAPRKFLDWANGGRVAPAPPKPAEPVRRLRYLTGDEP